MTATDPTPTTGTEVSSLSAAGKDELEALNFRGYFDWYVSTLPWRYSFGMLTWSTAAQVTTACTPGSRTGPRQWRGTRTCRTSSNPPATTFLYISDKPKTGGNTLFADARQRGVSLLVRRVACLEAVQRGGIIRTHPARERRLFMSTLVYAHPLPLPLLPPPFSPA